MRTLKGFHNCLTACGFEACGRGAKQKKNLPVAHLAGSRGMASFRSALPMSTLFGEALPAKREHQRRFTLHVWD